VVYRRDGPIRKPTSSLLRRLGGGCIKSRAARPVGSRKKARAIGKKGIKMKRERETEIEEYACALCLRSAFFSSCAYLSLAHVACLTSDYALHFSVCQHEIMSCIILAEMNFPSR
jgi:hypothetical protein